MRKADDRVRLSARLVRASDGMQLWSEDYYTPFADIFDIQDAIAKSVAAALQVRVPANAVPVPAARRTWRRMSSISAPAR